MDYLFDNTFKLISHGNREVLSMDLNKVDIEAVKKDIYKTVQPVIDAQPMPSINLQCCVID